MAENIEDAAYRVNKVLGPGFLKSLWLSALVAELLQ